MALDDVSPFAAYTVAGIGPYAVNWPYLADSVQVSIEKDGIRTVLEIGATLDPAGPADAGNVFLDPDTALANAGARLVIERRTPDEQGWLAVLGPREAGLEAQLDRMVKTDQELRRGLSGTLRVSGEMDPLVVMPGRVIGFDDEGKPVTGPAFGDIANAQANAEAAQAARDAAEDWAIKTDGPVTPGAPFPGPGPEYSAKWHAFDAARYARSQSYASRASAEADTVLSFVQQIAVVHNGLLLRYQRDPAGDALFTNGGTVAWSPASDAPHYLQHWGLVTYGTEGEALAAGAALSSGERDAQQTLIETAFGNWQGELVVHGWIEFFDRIIVNPRRIVRLSRDMDVDGLCASKRFNIANPDMIAGGLPLVRGCEIASLHVALDQADAVLSGLRSDLVAYPPVFSAQQAFGKIGHLRVSRAITAVALIGAGAQNNGGWTIDRLEYSAFGDGLVVDGPEHFVSIGEIDSWVFGFVDVANLIAIRNDGIARHADLRRADNLHIRRFGVFEGGAITIDVGAGLPVQIDALALDGDGAWLDLVSGVSQIAKLYGTESPAAPQLARKIRCSGGTHTITDADLTGDALAQIEVTGGDLKVGGRVFNSNLTVGQIAKVTGGELTLDGLEMRWPDGARVVPAVEQSSAGALRVLNCSVDPSCATPGEAVKWGAANARNEFAGAAFGAGHWINPTGAIRGTDFDVSHFGAGAAALTRMAAWAGYVRFASLFQLAEDATISVPLLFDDGDAAIEVADTFTLTVLDVINAPKHQIFLGDGDVVLGATGTVGEAAREVHASWFGVVPGIIDNPSNDQALGIQRISTAMGNLREGIIRFDIGNYEMWSTVSVNRAIGIEGDWSRRTVFNCRADGFIPFKTNGEAVRFEGIQFEHKDQLTTERASPYIKILHPACQVRDVAAGRAFRSVELASSNCIVERLSGFYNVAGSAGSSLIAVRGFHHTISELRCQSATFGPEAIVHLGAEITENANTTAHVHVEGIHNNSPARPFIIEATNHSVTSCSVDGVHDFAAAVRAGGVIRTLSGANNLDGVILSGLVASGNVQPALEIIMSGTASLRDVSVISLDANGTVGVGVAVTRSAGVLSTVSIGQGVNVRNRATPISTTGSGVGLIVAPGVIPNSAGVVSHTVTIPDDDVYIINMGADRFASRFSVVTNGAVFGTWRARAAASPGLTAMGTISALAAVTGALTGTTGADGAITVSVAAGGLYYVENRSGNPITVMLEVAG